MIVKDDTKYSCVECIRGHRSSSCKHHERPLLQVRSKGRPNIQNNPNYRIAIFAKEIDKSDSKITILKSSINYIVDFKTNDIVGPYSSDAQFQTNLTINENSFINATSCCSSGMQKKSCGCNHGNSSKSKILNNYISKNRKKFKFVNNNNEAKQQSLKEKIIEGLQKQVPPCYCGDGCKCDGCLIHDPYGNLESVIRDIGPFPFEPSHVGPSASGQSPSGPGASGQSGLSVGVQSNASSGLNGTNGSNGSNGSNGVGNIGAGDSGVRVSDNDGHTAILPDLPIEKDFFSQDLAGVNFDLPDDTKSFTSPQPNLEYSLPRETPECLCAEDECSCFNCGVHGIINGIKLDDVFGSIELKFFGP